VYGGFIEPARLVVRRETIDVPRWPPALSGLRVALVADLHVGSPHWDLSRIRELVAAVDAEQPDLILLGGDYRIHRVLFGTFVPETAIADALAGLRAPLGVFCVLGNHDVPAATKGPFEARGLRVLEDEVVSTTTRGTTSSTIVRPSRWRPIRTVARFDCHGSAHRFRTRSTGSAISRATSSRTGVTFS
jgi:predicted MPP superfamily phosphohydrolase